jgi:hypothetical protein
MVKFIISVTDFNDAITLKEWGIIDYTYELAEKTVKSGGVIVFERRYENAPNETIMEISTEEDLSKWKEKVSAVIQKIEKFHVNK